jgi:hypothetical protein
MAQSFLQSRPFYAIVTLLILALFYLAGPFSARTTPSIQAVSADARLARWIDAVTPPGTFRPQQHAYDPPYQKPIGGKSRKINLYPTGEEPKMGKPGQPTPDTEPRGIQPDDVVIVEDAVPKVVIERKKPVVKEDPRRKKWDAPDDDYADAASGVSVEDTPVVKAEAADGDFENFRIPIAGH